MRSFLRGHDPGAIEPSRRGAGRQQRPIVRELFEFGADRHIAFPFGREVDGVSSRRQGRLAADGHHEESTRRVSQWLD
ncbi:MAG TPA: hypothetical protein VFE09_01280 [Rubrobacteraceae bacterium]|nr:hypothetical protein [Rubrobacteraceae bacterium]